MRPADFPELKTVDEWAAKRLSSGEEPPWDWYQLMKLREAIRNLLDADSRTLAWDGSKLGKPALSVVPFEPPA